MSVCRLISQPFLPSASQSSKPSSHAMLQPSAPHDGVPWLSLHLCRHIRQSFGSLRFVSHWSSSRPLQSAVPGSQPMVVQVPPAQ
jgi:hypothetical protein